MTDILSFYTSHSPMTDPGPYAYLYDNLPDEPADLIKVINGVLIHKYTADDQLQLGREQRWEKYLRTMQQRLARIAALDPSPLTVSREPKEKQIAYCRDFAVFLVSILRHKHIPARLRVGFAEYFVYSPQYRGDHWITEYWDAAQSRWHLIDPDLGGVDIQALEEKVKARLKEGLDLTDVRLGKDFHVAASAWQVCRSGAEKPDLFRVNRRWRGWPVIRGNLLHDLQALNKLEMGLFDYWDELHFKPESEMTAKDKAILDQVAKVCLNPDETFDEMRVLFEEMPRTQILRSRLHLIGVLGGDVKTTSDLLESDMTRLIELTEATEAEAPTTDVTQPEVGPKHTVQDVEEQKAFDGIVVQGARQNNLKNIHVGIPRNKLVVITGVSGSGKSSLAFDTIYAEGQRRYVESLSSFARQFMRQMEKPQVDKVTGLNPAVAIEQHTISPNSRSTVGSITDVTDYLRVLFAHLGRQHCPQCGRAVEPQSAQQIARRLVRLPEGMHLRILAPLNRYGRLSISDVLAQARQDGFERIRFDGNLIDPAQVSGFPRDKKGHAIEGLVADTTVPQRASHDDRQAFYQQVLDAVERALDSGKGIVHLLLDDQELRLSSDRFCPTCNLALSKLEPQLLNANTVYGMCLECNGLGLKLQVDPARIITRPDRSLLDDASAFYMFRNLRKSSSSYWISYVQGLAEYYGADLEKPWNELPEEFRRTLIYGSEGKQIHLEVGGRTATGSFSSESTREIQGAIQHINRLYRQTKSESSRRQYQQFMSEQPCPACNGERLNREARFVSLAGWRFPEITGKNIGELLAWVRSLKSRLEPRQRIVGDELLAEIEQRLQFICDVGLHYLSLDRPGPTLSGGEAQRIRLAGQIGSELTGVLYVLDEPSIGLHPRDQTALLDLLCRLRDVGNSVLVVEHEAEFMRRADWLIDMGPGAGTLGGEIVAEGTLTDVMANPHSLTGKYLSGALRVVSGFEKRRRTPKGWLTLRGARLHNLKSVEARFPLGMFICLTGVSGSGKSSLITQTLFPALAQVLHNARETAGPYDGLEGAGQLERVIHITQAPIGRNPRSTPGTYVSVLDEIRKLFAATDQAKALGYTEGHFSFNAKGGRCEACQGYGANEIKLHLMANVWVRCGECEGKRFTPQVLEVRYRDKNIADVLDMDVQAAHVFFADQPRIKQMLQTLVDVGLGYIKLGQSATTLSGGEAQRIKLAKELGRKGTGDTLYILDEPTTGLHLADIQKLLDILQRLVEDGNTVMVIEHNLDVIKTADWIIDLGPEGGKDGGYIVAEGTPEDIARVKASYTGRFLRQVLTSEMALGLTS